MCVVFVKAFLGKLVEFGQIWKILSPIPGHLTKGPSTQLQGTQKENFQSSQILSVEVLFCLYSVISRLDVYSLQNIPHQFAAHYIEGNSINSKDLL